MKTQETEGMQERGGIIAFPAVVAIVVGIILLLPATSGSTPSIVLNAPYSGTVLTSHERSLSGCGASGALPKLPHFNLATGHAHLSSETSAVACANVTSNAYVYGESGLVGTTLALPNGPHSIRIEWRVTFTLDLAATPGASGNVLAEGGIFAYAIVIVSNGTSTSYTWWPSTSNYGASIRNGSLVTTFSDVVVMAHANETVVPGYTYAVGATIVAWTDATVYSNSGSASAQVTADSSSENARLVSITVT
jgi:hypothetical protein